MSSTAKVGSWMGKSSGKTKAEAYESESEGSSSAASVVSDVDETPAAHAEIESDEEALDDEIASPDADTRELNIDWEIVLPKVRPALLDRSRKRREQFASRFLYVTDDGG